MICSWRWFLVAFLCVCGCAGQEEAGSAPQAQAPAQAGGQASSQTSGAHEERKDFLDISELEQLQDRLPKDPDELEQRRRESFARLYRLQYETAALMSHLERARALETRINELEADIALAKEGGEEESKIARLERRLEEKLQEQKALGTTATLRDELARMQHSELELTDQVFAIGWKLANLSEPAQQEADFKSTITWIFALLVAIVIVGFFLIAARDENIRRTIFRGEAGIQFLTLFSLVIAIILFGITGTLEGRELAALLGGISGYILGRSSKGEGKEEQGADAKSKKG